MERRPDLVAFDVIETLFSLESLRPSLQAAGLPGHMLETWFAQLLRDAFAIDSTGVYRPFREMASETLRRVLAAAAVKPEAAHIDSIIAGFVELDAHPDVTPAMQMFRDAGVRIVTLTNGSASVTDKLLERAGLRDLVEETISVDEVQRWKPRREVYLHCAARVGVDPSRLALVAAHAWDVHGAARAGLITGYVDRGGGTFPDVMDPPHVTGSTLVEVVGKLLVDD